MDDIQSGSQTLSEARKLQIELINLLERGEWSFINEFLNHSQLYEDEQIREIYNFKIKSVVNVASVKALGMLWVLTLDCFSFKMSIDKKESYTKRDVLSQIVHLFDSMGLIGPIIMTAKIFLQKLWLLKLQLREVLQSAKKVFEHLR